MINVYDEYMEIDQGWIQLNAPSPITGVRYDILLEEGIVVYDMVFNAMCFSDYIEELSAPNARKYSINVVVAFRPTK